nr:multiubiquitin domain-containing protein [uncultured Rhodoferax sp.]
MSENNKPVSTGTESDKGHDDQHTTQIIINGRARQVSGKELTFVQVVNLAFDDAVFNDITVYTITFKGGEGNKPEGTLVEGETVKIKKGMMFNVKRTDKS